MPFAGGSSKRVANPHAGMPIGRLGPDPKSAAATLILLHGRGATAESILDLYALLDLPNLSALAPQAAGGSWYPYSFLAPIEQNQPHLDSALACVDSIIQSLLADGVPNERIALGGFSQGACLCCEYVARHPRQYGAVIAFTGGLIGPEGTKRDYEGSLDATPVFLGSGDPDPHVPFQRVRETEEVLSRMRAKVEVRRYPGMPHTISRDELEAARMYLMRVVTTESIA